MARRADGPMHGRRRGRGCHFSTRFVAVTRSDGNLILSRGCSGRSVATARKGNLRRIQQNATCFLPKQYYVLREYSTHMIIVARFSTHHPALAAALSSILRTAARDASLRLEAGGTHVSANGCSSSCPSCALPPCHPARMPRCRRGSDSRAARLHGSCSPNAEASGTWTAAIRSWPPDPSNV